MIKKKNKINGRDFTKKEKGKEWIVFGRFLALKSWRTNLKKTKIAFVVSKKNAKKAVERNKIKRRFFSLIGKNFSFIKKGYNLVFFVKKNTNTKNLSIKKIEDDINFLIKKAKLSEKQKNEND